MTTGRYELRGILGEGSITAVYRAQDAALGREVAVKTLLPGPASDPRLRQQFVAAARPMLSVRHPHIVQVFDVGEMAFDWQSGPRPFFSMEMVTGGSLAAVVARRQRLSLAQVADIAGRLGTALDRLHADGIVHRGVSPSGVMIDAAGRVVLMDPGLPLAPDQIAALSFGPASHLPALCSPEEARGTDVGPAADIYALGALVWWLLAGRPPFAGEPAAALRAQITGQPPPLRSERPELPALAYAALDAALAKQPAQRPASAGAFAEALRAAASTSGSVTAAPAPLPPVRPAASNDPRPSPPLGSRPPGPTADPHPSPPQATIPVGPPVGAPPIRPPAPPAPRGSDSWRQVLVAGVAGAGVVAVVALIVALLRGGGGNNRNLTDRQTPTATVSATATVSPSPTASPSATATRTATPPPSRTPTVVRTPTPPAALNPAATLVGQRANLCKRNVRFTAMVERTDWAKTSSGATAKGMWVLAVVSATNTGARAESLFLTAVLEDNAGRRYDMVGRSEFAGYGTVRDLYGATDHVDNIAAGATARVLFVFDVPSDVTRLTIVPDDFACT